MVSTIASGTRLSRGGDAGGETLESTTSCLATAEVPRAFRRPFGGYSGEGE